MAENSTKEIMAKLRSGNLADSEIEESAKLLSRLSRFGLKDVCILGKPGPDGTCGTFHVKPDDLPEFIKEYVGLKNPIIDFDVFPIGIVAPELFQVNMRIGSRRG